MTAEFWEYDARLGRRWNLDPVVKYWESGYASFHNCPIYFTDPLGLDPPKRLGFFKRFDNFMTNNAYKNKANKYAVDNNIDESDIHSSRTSSGDRYISMKAPYEKGQEAVITEKMFIADGEELHDDNSAASAPFKIAGLGFDYSSKASANYGVGVNGTVTNSSRIYGKSETDIQLANLTTVSGGGGLSANALKTSMGNESYGYLFFTNNYSLVPTTNAPKLAVTTSTQILWVKINYKVSMNLNGTGETWELKMGLTTKSSLDLSKQAGIEKRLSTLSTEEK